MYYDLKMKRSNINKIVKKHGLLLPFPPWGKKQRGWFSKGSNVTKVVFSGEGLISEAYRVKCITT